MKPAIKVIDPYVCPYDNGVLDLVLLTNGERVPITKTFEGETFYLLSTTAIKDCRNKEITPLLVCTTCGAIFQSHLSNNDAYCIDLDRANELEAQI